MSSSQPSSPVLFEEGCWSCSPSTIDLSIITYRRFPVSSTAHRATADGMWMYRAHSLLDESYPINFRHVKLYVLKTEPIKRVSGLIERG